ncbi:MAG: HEAT repeat domain-containing protein [Planctomycetota bacterium]
MKHIKLVLLGILLISALFLFISDVQHLYSACPGSRPPPPPPSTQPGGGRPVPGAVPGTPQQPKPPPSPGATTIRPSAQTPPRPSLGLGLQPFIQSSQALLGVVEPWEVWWTRNRDKYLSFREDIQWVKIVDDGGTQSVTAYPIYEELIKVLSDGLSDKDPYIAFRAAIGLGKIKEIQSISNINILDILKKANDNDKRFFVKNNVLLALGLRSDNSSAEIIKQVLVLQNEKSIPALTRSYTALAAGYIANDTEITKILKDIISDIRDDTEVRACACLSLGNLKDVSAVPILGKLLNGSDGKKEQPLIRAYAALGLGRIGTNEALDALKKSTVASEKESDVHSAVVIALGMTGLTEAKEYIIPFLSNRRDPKISGLSAISLAQTKDDKSYDLISEAFQKNKSNDADGLMLIALGLTGNDKAKTDLRKILENKRTRNLLQAAAAIGLGLLNDSEAIPIIVNMLNDEKQLKDVIVTPYLILSLGMIQDQKGVEVLQKIWEKIETNSPLLPYHTNVAVALTMLGKRKEVVLPKLIQQASQTKDPLIRAYALHAIGLVGDRESSQTFIEAYKDNNAFVRFETITGIGFLLDKNKINPLDKITADNIDVTMLIMDHILPIPVW